MARAGAGTFGPSRGPFPCPSSLSLLPNHPGRAYCLPMLALSSPTCTGDTVTKGGMPMRRRNRTAYRPPHVVSPPLYQPRIEIVRPRIRPRINLRVIEDRRTFHPEQKFRPAATLSRRDQRRLVEKARDVSKQGPSFFEPRTLGFAVPEKVARCVRRNQRREVILALNLGGKGARAPRRRRDQYSEISCKR